MHTATVSERVTLCFTCFHYRQFDLDQGILGAKSLTAT